MVNPEVLQKDIFVSSVRQSCKLDYATSFGLLFAMLALPLCLWLNAINKMNLESIDMIDGLDLPRDMAMKLRDAIGGCFSMLLSLRRVGCFLGSDQYQDACDELTNWDKSARMAEKRWDALIDACEDHIEE